MDQCYEVKAICKSRSFTCEACGGSIPEDNWSLEIILQTPDGLTHHHVHDNEGICHDKFLVNKRLLKPTFLSSRAT